MDSEASRREEPPDGFEAADREAAERAARILIAVVNGEVPSDPAELALYRRVEASAAVRVDVDYAPVADDEPGTPYGQLVFAEASRAVCRELGLPVDFFTRIEQAKRDLIAALESRRNLVEPHLDVIAAKGRTDVLEGYAETLRMLIAAVRTDVSDRYNEALRLLASLRERPAR